MVTRQTTHPTIAQPLSRSLQWRPGMVTRQTTRREIIRTVIVPPSMEAGNGYPANLWAPQRPRSMPSAFNGGREWLPGKPSISYGMRAYRPPFNGGREWLPGKPAYSTATWDCSSSLQWRPGMVTRQTPLGRVCSALQSLLQWRPGMVTRQTSPHGRPCSAGSASFNGGREWLPGKPPPTHPSSPHNPPLQWRPGMVTRQTSHHRTPCPTRHRPSMEAGNGYPANPEVRRGQVLAGRPSMEAGNGYPANLRASRAARSPDRPSMEAGNGYPANHAPGTGRDGTFDPFNGGREWLPGKLPAPLAQARFCCRLQWRPGMVTRQTRHVHHNHTTRLSPSMEAGNGYPANRLLEGIGPIPLAPSMEAGNGYPANAGGPSPAAQPTSPPSMEAGNGYPANTG